MERIDGYRSAIQKRALNAGAIYIDKYDLLCDDVTKTCLGVDETGSKVFADRSHLTVTGYRIFGQKLVAFGFEQLVIDTINSFRLAQ